MRYAFKLSGQYRADDINGVCQSELTDKVLDQVRGTMRPYGVNVIQLDSQLRRARPKP